MTTAQTLPSKGMNDSISVLHVDDDPSITDLTATSLERENDRFTVETAVSADEGLDSISNCPPDCIVSDYNMPGMDGIEFLQAVREEHPDLPFILFTGKGNEAVASEAIAADVTDYLQKGTGSEQYELLANRIQNAVHAQRETQRADRQKQLMRLTEFAGDTGGFELDTETGEILMTDGLRRLTDVPAQADLSLDEGIEMYHAEDREDIRQTIDRARQTGEQTHGTWRLQAQDGDERLVDVTFTPATTDGDTEQLRGAVHDITDQHEREEELELVDTLFEHAEECQFITDVADGEFELRHANTYYKRTVGLSPDEPVTGQTPTELFGEAGGQEILDRYRECVETREPVTYTVEVPVPEKGTVYRTILAPVVTDKEVTQIIGTARDITDHKHREEKLGRQNNRLEEFASIVSHDLRNPLDVAEAHLELAEGTSESEHVKKASDAIGRSQALIDDLLTLAREGDKVDETEPLELAEVAQSSWQTVETTQATFDAGGPGVIEADRSRLQQLFENLYRNAVEHGGEDVTVSVGGLSNGFYLADTGPGVPETERANVFGAGYSTNEEGTGLGLRIVEQIAEAHGWEVTVTESEQGGARFEFTGVERVE